MTSTPDDRTWTLLLKQLDRIEDQLTSIGRKLDDKVNYRTFNETKDELNERIDKLDEELENLTRAAVSPDQVSNLITDKLKESEARGVTRHERSVRYGVAIISMLTFAVLVYTTFLRHVG